MNNTSHKQAHLLFKDPFLVSVKDLLQQRLGYVRPLIVVCDGEQRNEIAQGRHTFLVACFLAVDELAYALVGPFQHLWVLLNKDEQQMMECKVSLQGLF